MKGQMTIFDYPEYLPKQEREVVIKGICDDGYCPECDAWLDDLTPTCPHCGTVLNWDKWKILNE